MIIQADIINQPYSGEYTEKIYNNESVWNSQGWTFIKFTNEDYTVWCGQFRGFPGQVAISTILNKVLVLTSDYLFQLDRETTNLVELEQQTQYQNLTVVPNGGFILSDYWNFIKLTTSIKKAEIIESPIQMDTIEFKDWKNERLEFTCTEVRYLERQYKMVYDSEANIVEVENVT